MTFAEEQTQDLLNIIEDNPVTFTWEGTPYRGFKGKLSQGMGQNVGGWLDEPLLSIVTTILVANSNSPYRFPNNELPEVTDQFTIEGRAYRVERIHKDPFGVAIQFDLVTPHKGAV